MDLYKGSWDPDGVWCSAQVLLDLLEAFEQVQHHWLLQAAVATGFPLWQLKLQIELYRAPRYLALGSVVSEAVNVQQTIIPGDGWATYLLKLALILPLDRLWSLHRTIVPMVVVDDLLLQRVGGT